MDFRETTRIANIGLQYTDRTSLKKIAKTLSEIVPLSSRNRNINRRSDLRQRTEVAGIGDFLHKLDIIFFDTLTKPHGVCDRNAATEIKHKPDIGTDRLSYFAHAFDSSGDGVTIVRVSTIWMPQCSIWLYLRQR